jgi:hypothetical protein
MDNNRSTVLKPFVIIFRQSPFPLSEADKQRRAEETAIWARHQNEAGHRLDPHILAAEGVRHRTRSSADRESDAWPITALLFLEARDLNQAAQVAESHPALRYGSEVEVRPWASPVPSSPAPKKPAVS